jgi:RNA polymerase-associated protein RTF1
LQVENLPLPTKKFIDRKLDAIHALLNRSWTEEELQKKLSRQNALNNRFAPIERSYLISQRKDALGAGDAALVASLDEQIAALDGPKLAFGTTLSTNPNASPSKPKSQQDRLAELNRANRRANAEEIRRAQLAEKRAERENAKAVARGEAAPNPFARVKTRAKTTYDVNDTLLPSQREGGSRGVTPSSDRAGTPGAGISTPIRAGTPLRVATPLAAKEKEGHTSERKKGIPTFRKMVMDDDVIGAMDLGIDIEI